MSLIWKFQHNKQISILILEKHDFVMLPVLLLFSFGKLGDQWSEDEEVTHELQTLTCLTYGFAREKSVNSVRNIRLSNVVGENDELSTKS